ncbi:ABC transporter ATP-binding protein [Maricaulis sp.]|uniref:ABC transporter ATP-binding protein n=1 Tax=Maricaulis sp. TaxID=1486257 RepID=UPI0026063EF4|nr:ABC transporter ATP-binding protein [Maricaulis sp.]
MTDSAVTDEEDFRSLEDQDDDPAKKTLSNMAVLRYLARQWARRPVLLTGMIVFMLAATVVELMIPLAAGRLIDALAAGPDASSPWPAFALYLGAAAVYYALRQSASRCEVPFSAANMADLTTEAFAKVQRFSLDWHANTFAGSVVRKITRGMWAYDTITFNIVLGVAPAVLVMLGISLVMAVRWPLVGGAAFVIMTAFVISSLLLSRYYIRPQNIRSNALDSEIGGALADSIGGVATVKSFGSEAREDGRFHKLTWRWHAETRKTWGRYVNSWLVNIATDLTMQAALVGLLVWQWSRGAASAGDVVAALTAYMIVSSYMRRFGEHVQQVQRGLDEIQDLAAFDLQQSEVRDAPDAAEFRRGEGAIRFDQVGFTYAGQERPVYTDFSLDIAPGEKVALVGPTGSGKSTFVKLVQRLYDVSEGGVLIDGQDVRAVTQDSLRRSIALVPQDPALFHRSIAENIAYGRPDASLDEVKAAAEAAHADGFIDRLPQGYDTLVGERGVKLSGGERQRVAIARAILADAPILILDEATSSLDNETEREIQQAMGTVMQGRTTIIIAHRLSTIRDADRILVFENGRIVEQGTHDQLEARTDGVYARLAALAAG